MFTFDWPAINHISRLGRGDHATLSETMFARSFSLSSLFRCVFSPQLAPITTHMSRFFFISLAAYCPAPFGCCPPAEPYALQRPFSSRCLVLIWINLINHTVCLDCTPIRLLLMPVCCNWINAWMCGFPSSICLSLFAVHVAHRMAVVLSMCRPIRPFIIWRLWQKQACESALLCASMTTATAAKPARLPPHSLANICGSLLLLSFCIFLFHPTRQRHYSQA